MHGDNIQQVIDLIGYLNGKAEQLWRNPPMPPFCKGGIERRLTSWATSKRKRRKEQRMGKIKLEIPLEELAKTITELPPKEREELWSLLATFEEASDRGALEALKESEEDVKKGRLHSFEEVFRESL